MFYVLDGDVAPDEFIRPATAEDITPEMIQRGVAEALRVATPGNVTYAERRDGEIPQAFVVRRILEAAHALDQGGAS